MYRKYNLKRIIKHLSCFFSRLICEQVSHHPPISAFHAESDTFVFHGWIYPKLKLWGKSVEVHPKGNMRLFLKKYVKIDPSVSCFLIRIVVWSARYTAWAYNFMYVFGCHYSTIRFGYEIVFSFMLYVLVYKSQKIVISHILYDKVKG